MLPTFPGDAATAQLFLQEWAPIAEQRSEPYMRYELFTPRYVVLRDLGTFDLRENRRLGPSLRLRLSQGLTALGATFSAVGLGARWGVVKLPSVSPRRLSYALALSLLCFGNFPKAVRDLGGPASEYRAAAAKRFERLRRSAENGAEELAVGPLPEIPALFRHEAELSRASRHFGNRHLARYFGLSRVMLASIPPNATHK